MRGGRAPKKAGNAERLLHIAGTPSKKFPCEGSGGRHMITIDGANTNLRIENFANLEEILVRASSDSRLDNRIVTDVLLNDEVFSELYPHQAEDIAADAISSVEIRSVPFGEMALNIAGELYKVNEIMSGGSRQVARLFREGENEEALELFQDLLDVTRDFISMVGVLRSEFTLGEAGAFSANVEQLSGLLGEMSEVLESEDWILLADLLEYELIPASENWKQIIQSLRETIRQNQRA